MHIHLPLVLEAIIFFVGIAFILAYFIKSYLNETMREFFWWVVPQNDSFAFSVLATGKYAQTLLSANSELEILLVYKNLKGYNIKNFLKEFSEILDSSGMKFVIKIAEVDEIFINFKDDLKFKKRKPRNFATFVAQKASTA